MWSGVRNALAQKHLRAVKKGDVSDPYPDPEDRSGKYVAVDVAPVTRLPWPVTLAEIKADAGFKDSPLAHRTAVGDARDGR